MNHFDYVRPESVAAAVAALRRPKCTASGYTTRLSLSMAGAGDVLMGGASPSCRQRLALPGGTGVSPVGWDRTFRHGQDAHATFAGDNSEMHPIAPTPTDWTYSAVSMQLAANVLSMSKTDW